jgi:hypothetical protein
MARYTTDEVIAMMQSPQPEVEMLERPASPFLDPAQINAAERELTQPAPEVPRPDSINAPGANLLLQNYTAEEAFPIDQTPAPQRPADGNATLYPSRAETSPNLPKPRYTTDEVISLYANESKPRLSTKQVMVEMIKPLYDPTLPRPSREEFFKLRELEKQLRESGDIPSNFEETTKAVGGFFLTAADALNTSLWKVDREQGLFEFGGMGVNPALAVSETWRRSPGTLAYGAEMTKQGYASMDAGLRAMGGPRYRVKETGEFIMPGDMDSSLEARRGVSGGDIVKEYAARGMTLVPVNDEDRRDFEYLQWNQGMDRAMEVEKARTADYPEETVYKILSNAPAGFSDTAFGTDYLRALENRPAPPMESQAVGASILADPATYLSLGAGAAKIGLSAAMKGATARSLDVIGKATQRFVNPAEVPVRAIERFRKAVVSPAKVAGAYGAASGVAWAADQFNLPSELKSAAFTAASLYTAYKGGLGVLRFVGKRFPEAAVILRESADATSGLDRAARQAVATNPNVPANIRDRLLRPSQFVAMESTPARLAQNQQLSPGTRKLMDKLSNFYVVQGVRGASAVATGAVKGGATMVPFAEAMRLSGDERSADTMYGMGIALGALGGAGERVLGARGRRMAQAESDIGRMLTDIQAGNVQPGIKRYQWIDREVGRLLTDVELAAGDVTALLQNRSFDELARTAAMQGFFRNVDYIPLNAADFELNAKEHGGSGAAGYFIKAPVGERPQIFVNVEARRADVEPHEYFEAFFASDAFSPEQRAAMRAQIDQHYGAEGLMARGREYAEAIIKADNAKNFPNETLVVSDEQIRIKMDELAQDELGRGGQDPLDWVRREVMVEEARLAGVDFASIRRNVPAGANPITFMENVLGASARALGLSGVRIDPETGIAITPEQLFRENPVAANDPKLVKHLNDYIKAYRQWMNDPTHEVPQGVRIARDGRVESLADNPNVSFYSPRPEDPTVPRENALAIMGPDGRVIEKSPKQRRTERKARNTQVKNLAGRNLLAPGDPTFGLKRWADGRIRAGGRRLPQSMALQVHWKPWLPIINAIEGLADANESMQVRYFAKGNSADKVKTSRFSDVDAINREVVFDQWTTNAAGDLLAQLLDMTTLRNRAMRAISERHPALDPANGGPGYSLQAIMDDVNQWMADKRAGKDGAATIGNDRKNVVNALINPGTAVNRGKNPLAGTFGKGSAIKTLILENINAVSGTGRKGVAMDYNWANGNFMPDKPAPRPDMDSDVPAPRGLVNRQPARAQMMPDYSGRADIPLDERARRAAFVSADGRVVTTGKRTHFETNEDLGPDFLAIGAGSIGEDGFFRFGSETMDDAMGETPGESMAAAARHNQAVYDSGRRPSKLLEDPPGLERGAAPRAQMMADDVNADAVGLRSAKFLEQAVGDGMENLRAKQAKREGTGVAKNKFVRFHDNQGRPIYIGAIKKDGGKSFAGWIEETEAWQSPEETAAYRQWYRELKGYFTEIFGDRAGEMMMAWLAAQQNVSPGGALGNVFKVEDRLAGIGTGKKGGLADGKIQGVLLGEVPEGGFGPKLTDFVDAGFLREYRTYMAKQPAGGRPFVADVHTGRDSGHVDQQTLTRLKQRADEGDLFIDGRPTRVKVLETKTVKQGNKTVIVPERIRVIPQGSKGFDVGVDMRGSPGGPKYEGISEWGNAMTDHLNKIGWRGGEWTPAEVQAVGWMRVLRQYGLPEPTVLSALQQNTSRIYAEVNYSSGNLLPANYPAFDSLTPDVQRAITMDVIEGTVNELAPIIGGSLRVQRVSAGTGAWGNMRSPTTVIEALGSAEATDLFGLALATVSEQAATMSATFGVGGKNSRALSFKKRSGEKFTDAEMQSIIDDAEISGYTMQQLPGGDTGLIADATKDFKPKGLTKARASQVLKKLLAWADSNGIDIEVRDVSARITSYGNNWKNNTDGQAYLSEIVRRGGAARVRDIVRFRGRYAEILREAYQRHAPETVVPDAQEQVGPIRQAAESPPLEILEMLRGA